MYPSCAGDIVTAPSLDDGQMNRPRSSLFENRHAPWPSCQIIFTRSPRLPRKTKRCPAWGSDFSVSCTISARPGKPRRISVWPAASQTLTPAGTGITDWLSEWKECAPRLQRRYPERYEVCARPQERLRSGMLRPQDATKQVMILAGLLLPPFAELAIAQSSMRPGRTPGMRRLPLWRHLSASDTASSGQRHYCGRPPRCWRLAPTLLQRSAASQPRSKSAVPPRRQNRAKTYLQT